MIELPIRVAAPEVDHVDALVSGTRLGEFEILGLLGVGGFGMVYRAYDHSLHRDVAIKEYMPTSLARRADDVLNISIRTSADHPTFQVGLASFVGEARMLAKFEHPSLVRVFRFWEANGTAYMVMPLYRGMTLKQARKRMQTPPNEAWLRKVLWSILGALKVLHRGHALHRDVSPDNIFLQDIGPPVLLDLGAARVAINDTSKQHTAILKVNFAPIEQYADVRDMPQGPWTDLYSLAAVVHCMLCNEAPMPATIRAVNDSMPTFVSIAKTVETQFGLSYSEGFVAGIASALSIHPQDRPQSVQEFARALGLATPNGMSSFDWRGDLGPACLPTGELLESSTGHANLGLLPASTGSDYLPTQLLKPAHDDDSDDDDGPATIISPWEPTDPPEPPAVKLSAQQKKLRERAAGLRQAENDRILLSTESAALEEPLIASASVNRRSNIAWVVVSSVIVLGLAVAAWSWHSHSGNAAPAVVAPVVTPIMDTTVTAPKPPVSGAVSTIAPASASVAATVSIPSPVIMPDPSPAPPTAPAPAAKPVTKPSTQASNRRNGSAVTSAKKSEIVHPSVATEPAPTPVAPEPPPAPEPKPAAPLMTAEKLCADKGLFTRPMCIFKACQRPELINTPTCIENEQRLKRNSQNTPR
jgi:serine/threonine protein kinase